jgi:hypothetical protein
MWEDLARLDFLIEAAQATLDRIRSLTERRLKTATPPGEGSQAA